MSIFESLGIAGTGVTVYRKWMDAVSDNIANLNTVKPTSQAAFQARYVIASSIEGGDSGEGAQVSGVAYGSATGRLVYDPSNPLADKKGYVRYPDIDLVLADDAADHGPARLPGEPGRHRPGQGRLQRGPAARA